jgi:hypothetical protein
MKRPSNSLIWGGVLLVVGLAFLLWNLDVFAQFQATAQLVVAGLFALLGIGFFVDYLVNREQWWKVIPAFTLLAVAGTIFLAGRAVNETWIALLFFLGLALAFAFIYVTDRASRWWALLPFGAMGTMALVILLGMTGMPAKALGAILFALMGLIFFLIYLLAKDRKQFGWALVPTAALWIMALVALASYLPEAYPALGGGIRFWPIALVVAGVVLLGYGITRSGRQAPIVSELPAQPAPSETPAAPGASVFEVPEEPSSSRRIERSPITLVDDASESAPDASTAPAPGASGEVPDIYEFLQSAPPDGKS